MNRYNNFENFNNNNDNNDNSKPKKKKTKGHKHRKYYDLNDDFQKNKQFKLKKQRFDEDFLDESSDGV